MVASDYETSAAANIQSAARTVLDARECCMDESMSCVTVRLSHAKT